MGRSLLPQHLLILLVLAMVLAGCQAPLLGERKPDASPTATLTGSNGTPDSSAGTAVVPGEPTIIEAPGPPPPPEATGQQTLTLAGAPAGPATLDPALIRDVDSAFVARQIFRGLVRLDESLQPVPDLARRIEIAPDGLTYTFELWDDTTFANGKPISAEDVKFSLERATDPALVEGTLEDLPARTYLGDIAGVEERITGKAAELAGVEVVDRRTVRIRLAHPAASFLTKLATTPAFVVDRENVAAGPEWWKKANGSGPFALAEWRDRDRIVLQAHQGYAPHPPTLKTVTFLIGTGAFQPTSLYERGLIDATNAGIDALDRLKDPQGMYKDELHVAPLLATSYVLFNPNVPPLDDPAIRQALLRSFDRTKIANVTFDGHVKPAKGLLPDGLLGREWPAEVPAYDLDAGRALLDEATGGERPTLTIYTTGSPTAVAMKRVYEQDLQLPVEVLQFEWNDFLQELSGRNVPALSVAWVADYPDPDTFLRSLFYSTSPDNYIGYNNPEVDRLLDEARGEPDEARRIALYEEAQQRIIDDGVVMPIYEDVSYLLVKPYVHGMTLTPLGILGLETVWITK